MTNPNLPRCTKPNLVWWPHTQASKMGRQVLLLLLVLGHSYASAAGLVSLPSLLKAQRSSPVLPVVVDNVSMNLILTTDLDGVLLCADLPVNASLSTKIDFDYARKLLRFQLQAVTQEYVVTDVAVPSLAYAQPTPVGVFFLSRQWLSPASLEFFLQNSNAAGFIGVGYAFRVAESPFWNILGDGHWQYHYRIDNTTSEEDKSSSKDKETKDVVSEDSKVALLSASAEVDSDDAGGDSWDWSEPCSSVDQADDDNNNNQGLVFPIHRLQFECQLLPSDTMQDDTDSDEATADDNDEATSSAMRNRTHQVHLFGEYTSNWDAMIDFNSPCLALPQQFYNSLAGWVGLKYDEELKLSTIAPDVELPTLHFSLTHDGPVHQIALADLVLLNESSSTSLSASSGDGAAWICIQRSASIVHTGASVFSAINSDATTVQRYRLHGSMALPVFNMFQAPIVFGHMTLTAFGDLIVDGDAKQVAFPHPATVQNRQALVTSARAMCLPLEKCIGQQVFVPRLNVCQDPDCAAYYFQSLNDVTKKCVIDPDWLVFLFTAVVVLLSAEVGLFLRVQQIIKDATSSES